MGMWVCTYDQAHVLAFKIFGRFYVAFGTNIFLSPSFGTSNATKITQLDEGMTKICFFQVKGVMGMWVCTYDRANILELKIFGCHYVAFGAQKDFVTLHLAHPIQQKSLKSMKE